MRSRSSRMTAFRARNRKPRQRAQRVSQHERLASERIGVGEDRGPGRRFKDDLRQAGDDGGEVDRAHPASLAAGRDRGASDPDGIEHARQAEVSLDIRLEGEHAAADESATDEDQPGEVTSESAFEQQPQSDQCRHVPRQVLRRTVDQVTGPQPPDLAVENRGSIEPEQTGHLRHRCDRERGRSEHQGAPR